MTRISEEKQIRFLVRRVSEPVDHGIVIHMKDQNAVPLVEFRFVRGSDLRPDVIQNPGAVLDLEDGELQSASKPGKEFGKVGPQLVGGNIIDNDKHSQNSFPVRSEKSGTLPGLQNRS